MDVWLKVPALRGQGAPDPRRGHREDVGRRGHEREGARAQPRAVQRRLRRPERELPDVPADPDEHRQRHRRNGGLPGAWTKSGAQNSRVVTV